MAAAQGRGGPIALARPQHGAGHRSLPAPSARTPSTAPTPPPQRAARGRTRPPTPNRIPTSGRRRGRGSPLRAAGHRSAAAPSPTAATGEAWRRARHLLRQPAAASGHARHGWGSPAQPGRVPVRASSATCAAPGRSGRRGRRRRRWVAATLHYAAAGAPSREAAEGAASVAGAASGMAIVAAPGAAAVGPYAGARPVPHTQPATAAAHRARRPERLGAAGGVPPQAAEGGGAPAGGAAVWGDPPVVVGAPLVLPTAEGAVPQEGVAQPCRRRRGAGEKGAAVGGCRGARWPRLPEGAGASRPQSGARRCGGQRAAPLRDGAAAPPTHGSLASRSPHRQSCTPRRRHRQRGGWRTSGATRSPRWPPRRAAPQDSVSGGGVDGGGR